MKKYSVVSAVLAALVSGSVLAATPSDTTKQQNKKLSMDWSINNMNDQVYLTNSTESDNYVYIAVRKNINGSDRVTVTGCKGGTEIIMPDSLLTCQIVSGQRAIIQIDSKDFKYGAEGEWSTD